MQNLEFGFGCHSTRNTARGSGLYKLGAWWCSSKNENRTVRVRKWTLEYELTFYTSLQLKRLWLQPAIVVYLLLGFLSHFTSDFEDAYAPSANHRPVSAVRSALLNVLNKLQNKKKVLVLRKESLTASLALGIRCNGHSVAEFLPEVTSKWTISFWFHKVSSVTPISQLKTCHFYDS